jgi:hypothetical protein
MRGEQLQPTSFVRRIIVVGLILSVPGCFATRAHGSSASVAHVASPVVATAIPPSAFGGSSGCSNCGDTPLQDEKVSRAIERRIADLKTRGGICANVGSVLENSYRSGQITLRPYMWRVGSLLASGEARPNGDMIIAREIDSLNVGRRSVDDLIASMEHEAAHIAFKIDNDVTSDRADAYVRACKA